MAEVYDCIVIGSGAGGLAASLRLAREGRSVLLLEAARDFGGMLNPFTRGRYHFDVGVHYVGLAGPGQPMRNLLDRLGLDDLRFLELDPDCIDRYVYDGYEGKLVKGLERWIDQLVADFPAEERGLRRFGRTMKLLDEAGRMPTQGLKAGTLGKLALQPLEVWKLLHETFGSLLDRYFKDPHLKAVLSGPGGDIGLPPGRASAAFHMALLLHYLGGAYYPVGGGGGMRDAFLAALDKAGVERKNNALVEALVRDGDHWNVVVAGTAYRAKTVISNADVVDTMAMVRGVDVPAPLQDKLRHTRPSLGSVSVYVGTSLDLAATHLGTHNIWHYGTTDIDGLYEPLFRGELPESTAFFLSSSTLKDPTTRRAPPGHHTLEIVAFAPSAPFQPWFDQKPMRRGPQYQAMKQQVVDRLLAGAETYLPGLGAHIEVLESSSPATVWSYVRGRGGGIYGPEHSPDQVILNRFKTQSGLPGLFLAGASVTGCGVHTCLSSGSAAGRAVVAELTKA